ncbi:diaminopimelate epimerase [Egicoccus halophilus]|uniref:Diaminopimelate epimerase n=1 Tax=Egicoccus halophilus TaxID=1670830 RepID=A0A8J3AAI9_9ACTN|nr:diaminopimelate epimerase [Egicoccus halophilus]GGI06620.1 diaminopimelate epimerase [Egicoccus halophilus]
MEFTKAHGTGNDFVVLRDPDDHLDVSAALVRALCDRRFGIGADGVIRVGGVARLEGANAGADVFMDYRNADGSVVEMCGNGVRVTAKHAVDHGLVTPREDGTVVVATRSGPRPVRVVARHADGTVAEVEVDMGPPALEPVEVPFDATAAGTGPAVADAFGPTVQVGDRQVELAVVSMGNPHAILTVDDVGTAPVTTLGPTLETHAAFPAKTNVEFAQVVDRGSVRLRVWERGVGETAACGTGACATVVALRRAGRVDDEVAVRLPGGTLTVRWHAGGSVYMTGPAVEVGHGTLDDAWLRDARSGLLETAP